MSDSGQSQTGTERCLWCEEDVENLVTKEACAGLLVSGLDSKVLNMTYGDVCPQCWDSIRDQWERMGNLSKPLSAFGGGFA